MKILILGATGGVGLAFLEECLLAQHHAVVFARSPQKIPTDISSNPNVTIHTGQLTDEIALKNALTGVHAVISGLGPGPFHPSGTPLAKAYAVLIKLMQESGVKRLIALGTASNKDTNDKPSVVFWSLVTGVSTFAHTAYKDMVAVGETIRSDPELLWTLGRVPILTNKESKPYHAGYIGDGHTAAFLSRKAFAAFVVSELSKNEWIRKSPLISST